MGTIRCVASGAGPANPKVRGDGLRLPVCSLTHCGARAGTHNYGVDCGAQRRDALHSLVAAPAALKGEGVGHDSHSQHACVPVQAGCVFSRGPKTAWVLAACWHTTWKVGSSHRRRP